MIERKKISIMENGIWAGTGDLIWTEDDGGRWVIDNCPAELGNNGAESEATYEAIESAINDSGNTLVRQDGLVWTWDIYDAD